MMMNVFGVPFAGGNICGFSGPNSSLSCVPDGIKSVRSNLSPEIIEIAMGAHKSPTDSKTLRLQIICSITDIMRDAI
jgi:hypothetical protein